MAELGAKPRGADASTALAALDIAILLFLGWASLFVTPRFAQIFADLGGRLPALTQAVLWLGRIGAAGAAVILSIMLALKESLIRDRRLTLWMNVAALAALLAAVGLYVLAMWLPLCQVIDAVGQP